MTYYDEVDDREPRPLHAHVDTASADCDGPMYRGRVEGFNEDEHAESQQEYNDFSEIHFMQRIMLSVVSPYAVMQARVTLDEDGIEVHETTEEGYRQASVRWCRGFCDLDESWQRDVYAEQMGY